MMQDVAVRGGEAVAELLVPGGSGRAAEATSIGAEYCLLSSLAAIALIGGEPGARGGSVGSGVCPAGPPARAAPIVGGRDSVREGGRISGGSTAHSCSSSHVAVMPLLAGKGLPGRIGSVRGGRPSSGLPASCAAADPPTGGAGGEGTAATLLAAGVPAASRSGSDGRLATSGWETSVQLSAAEVTAPCASRLRGGYFPG